MLLIKKFFTFEKPTYFFGFFQNGTNCFNHFILKIYDESSFSMFSRGKSKGIKTVQTFGPVSALVWKTCPHLGADLSACSLFNLTPFELCCRPSSSWHHCSPARQIDLWRKENSLSYSLLLPIKS
jgi:hypothetical protein